MPEPVRVLLDEGVPEKLRAAFSEAFLVETVRYRGWVGLKNGELLRAAVLPPLRSGKKSAELGRYTPP